MNKSVLVPVVALLAIVCANCGAAERAAARGYIDGGGCKRIDEVSVCRDGDVAKLRLRRLYARLLDGYLADDQTYYDLSRGGGVYRLRLGRPGLSDNPTHSSYTVEFVSHNGIKLLEIQDDGDMECGNRLIRYSNIIDIGKKRLVFKYYDDVDGRKSRKFITPLPDGYARHDISYNDYLEIITKEKRQSEYKVCEIDP
jgi:hypothetical protein